MLKIQICIYAFIQVVRKKKNTHMICFILQEQILQTKESLSENMEAVKRRFAVSDCFLHSVSVLVCLAIDYLTTSII